MRLSSGDDPALLDALAQEFLRGAGMRIATAVAFPTGGETTAMTHLHLKGRANVKAFRKIRTYEQAMALLSRGLT